MKTIMIIDDEIEVLNVLQTYLGRNYLVETYTNPKHALEAARKNQFDLILSDIMMPGCDGFTILEEIKNHNNNAKVVLMTAYDTHDKVEKSEELFADGYIKKPFESLKNLEQTIQNIM